MNRSFIEAIYNNTEHTFAMWSTDDEHNGVFRDFDSGIRVGDNDWGNVLVIAPGARLKASMCGIPWYKEGTNYLVITRGDRKQPHGLRMYQSESDAGARIHFVDHATGQPVGEGRDAGVVLFPFGTDRQLSLTIDEKDGEFEFMLQNRQGETGKQDFAQPPNRFAGDFYGNRRKVRIEIARAIAGKAALKE